MILAIDQGTTGTTCLVFDREGRIRGRAYSELAQHFAQPGWVEHDPTEIWEGVKRVASRALADALADAASLDAIGITNQRARGACSGPHRAGHRPLLLGDQDRVAAAQRSRRPRRRLRHD
jgi:sugar (pentulose or hexulose) kinase